MQALSQALVPIVGQTLARGRPVEYVSFPRGENIPRSCAHGPLAMQPLSGHPATQGRVFWSPMQGYMNLQMGHFPPAGFPFTYLIILWEVFRRTQAMCCPTPPCSNLGWMHLSRAHHHLLLCSHMMTQYPPSFRTQRTGSLETWTLRRSLRKRGKGKYDLTRRSSGCLLNQPQLWQRWS